MLGFVATSGPLTTDLYLPPLAMMAIDLGVSLAAVQLSLTSFLIGIAEVHCESRGSSRRNRRRPIPASACGRHSSRSTPSG